MSLNGNAPVRRANVLGVGIDVVDLDEAAALLIDAAQEGRGGYVCVRDVHGVMQSHRDPELRAIHNRSLLTTADGMPVVWVGRAQGHRMSRVRGPDLMLEVCERSVGTGLSHFFYGGAEGVAEQLAETLSRRFPGLEVAGTYAPPFRPLGEREERELVEQVESARPDFFWVGLGTPKQERFMAAYQPRLPDTVMLGVGAAFDIHTGRIRQAPVWVRDTGFEWLYRLAQEPRRLLPRYLVNNPLFLWHIALQGLGVRSYELSERGSGRGAPE